MLDLIEVCENSYFKFNQRIRDEKTAPSVPLRAKDFAASIGSQPTIDDLTDDNVAGLIVYLQEKQLAAKTINERRGRINALWTWLAKRGQINRWPTTPRIPEPERTPVAWLREELPRLFKAFERERVMIEGICSPLWWKSLHYVFWDTGERISALVQCEWSHFDGGWLVIPAELRKAKRKDRAYPLASDTIELLKQMRLPARKAIWPWPYSPDYLWTRYKIIRGRAGLPTDRRSSFHRMRRSVASHFEAAGGDATELLDHTSRQVTRSYLDPRIVRPPQAIDLLFRPE